MRVGVGIFPTTESISIFDLASEVEARPFDSLFFPDHTHIPVREAPTPNGAPLPEFYSKVFDPVTALAAIAVRTSRISIGTAVCLIPQRDPIILAKQLASVDVWSRGRLIVGVGAGWHQEEMRNHGTEPEERFAIMAERVAAIRTLWTQDEPAFDGKYVSFDPLRQEPRPVQRPHPPLLVGGNGQRATERAARYGDGWMPNYASDHGAVIGRLDELSAHAERAGRGPLPVTIVGVPPDRQVLEECAAAGIERVVFWTPSARRDVVLPVLDAFADLQRHVGDTAE